MWVVTLYTPWAKDTVTQNTPKFFGVKIPDFVSLIKSKNAMDNHLAFSMRNASTNDQNRRLELSNCSQDFWRNTYSETREPNNPDISELLDDNECQTLTGTLTE